MTELFELYLQNSFSGILFILVILLIRQLTKSMSKIYVNVLWILLLIELLFAPFITGPFHTIRNLTFFAQNEEAYDNSDYQEQKIYDNFGAVDQNKEAASINGGNINPADRIQGTWPYKNTHNENNIASADIPGFANNYGLIDYLSVVWFLGIIILSAFFLIQYTRLRRKVKAAIKADDNVWESSSIDIPFVMPGIPVKIYVPAGLEGQQREYILAHERQHIKHLDPWKKCIATLALIVHWYNPFVWIAYSMIGKDIEMFCDERVLRKKGLDEKKQYSQTILDFAAKANGFSLTMGFAKNNTENRIKHILYSKKTPLIISIVLVAVILSCGVFFLTAKGNHNENAYYENNLNKAQEEENAGESVAENDTKAFDEGAISDNISADDMDADNKPANEGQSSENKEEEFWDNKLVAGIEIEPDPDLKARILNAPDYASEWDNLPKISEDMFGTPQEEEINNAVNLIGKTQHYLLYGASYMENMIVKTPDDRYVYAEVPYTSNYFTQPMLNEIDYDRDGENELAIIIYVIHGTGISKKTLFMVDRANDGNWYMYQLLESEYLPRLESKFDTVHTDDSIKLLFDGKFVGRTLPMDNEFRDRSYKFYAGMQIEIYYIEDRIVMNTELGGFSDTYLAGDFTGHKINADIIYLGEGKWNLENFRYSDDNIDLPIKSALILYFTGKTQEVNNYYMAEGSKLKGIKKRSENVTILDISYPVDNLDSGRIEAHATVRLDGNDSLCFVTIPMKMENSVTDTWKITDLIIEDR